MLANGQNSFNCSEESCNNPFADNYINLPNIYNLCSEEAENMGFKKGYIPWNKGKHSVHLGSFVKGMIPWNKGKKHISGMTGKKHTKESNEKNRQAHVGKIHSGCFKKGCVPWTKGLIGEQSPLWKGGISFFPYCQKFNNKLRETIRNRDNRTCQLCGVKENGRKLSIHHIHYDKENCEPDLIALCVGCNSKVNHNRNYYEELFIELLRSRGIL